MDMWHYQKEKWCRYSDNEMMSCSYLKERNRLSVAEVSKSCLLPFLIWRINRYLQKYFACYAVCTWCVFRFGVVLFKISSLISEIVMSSSFYLHKHFLKRFYTYTHNNPHYWHFDSVTVTVCCCCLLHPSSLAGAVLYNETLCRSYFNGT